MRHRITLNEDIAEFIQLGRMPQPPRGKLLFRRRRGFGDMARSAAATSAGEVSSRRGLSTGSSVPRPPAACHEKPRKSRSRAALRLRSDFLARRVDNSSGGAYLAGYLRNSLEMSRSNQR